jgi:hypothetical protein
MRNKTLASAEQVGTKNKLHEEQKFRLSNKLGLKKGTTKKGNKKEYVKKREPSKEKKRNLIRHEINQDCKKKKI